MKFKEIWVDIPNYEGCYQISNLGRVKSLERYIDKNHHIMEKILASTMKKGYPSVNLSKSNETKTFYVHYLVAIMFLNKSDFKFEKEEKRELIDFNTLEINHKNENKLDNKAENLEWCTHLYNMRYGTGIKRSALKQLNNEKNSKPIGQFTKDGVLVKKYPSIMEAYRQTKNIPTLISQCCKNKRRTTGGYKWKYVNE